MSDNESTLDETTAADPHAEGEHDEAPEESAADTVENDGSEDAGNPDDWTPEEESADEDDGDDWLTQPRKRIRSGVRVSKTLRQQIEGERLSTLAHEHATVRLEIDEVEREKKERVKEFNDALEGLKERSLKLARSIDTGTEDTTVTCEWYFEPATGMKYLIRKDTGEEIESRMMSDAEKEAVNDANQMDLFADEITPNEGTGDSGVALTHELDLDAAQQVVDEFLIRLRFDIRSIRVVKSIRLHPQFADTLFNELDNADATRPSYWPSKAPSDKKLWTVPFVIDDGARGDAPIYVFLDENGDVVQVPLPGDVRVSAAEEAPAASADDSAEAEQSGEAGEVEDDSGATIEDGELPAGWNLERVQRGSEPHMYRCTNPELTLRTLPKVTAYYAITEIPNAQAYSEKDDVVDGLTVTLINGEVER